MPTKEDWSPADRAVWEYRQEQKKKRRKANGDKDYEWYGDMEDKHTNAYNEDAGEY